MDSTTCVETQVMCRQKAHFSQCIMQQPAEFVSEYQDCFRVTFCGNRYKLVFQKEGRKVLVFGCYRKNGRINNISKIYN